MATILTAAGKARALTEFALRAGPIFWRRMTEDSKRSVKPAPRVPLFAAWPQEGVQAAWIGHSTVVIRVDGFTILTDPVFSTRIGISIGPFTLGMKRLVYPRPNFLSYWSWISSYSHMHIWIISTARVCGSWRIVGPPSSQRWAPAIFCE
jgi:hypothetical protein